MTNMYKEKTSCDCANISGAPDVLYPGDAVEMREKMPKQKLAKGQRAVVDKIFGGGRIGILPFNSTTVSMVRVRDIYKLDWGN